MGYAVAAERVGWNCSNGEAWGIAREDAWGLLREAEGSGYGPEAFEAEPVAVGAEAIPDDVRSSAMRS